MANKIETISKDNNFAKNGIVFGVIMTLMGLFPKDIDFEFWILKVNITIPIDSWAIIFLGLAILFYFISIRANQYEVKEGGFIVTNTPRERSKLSEEIKGVSIFAIILFILRGIYLLVFRII